jgi:hypothetical protein
VNVSNGLVAIPENFIPCLELLAWAADAKLDESLIDAFEGGLLGTDEDADRWYELPWGNIEVAIARNVEGYIFFQVKSNDKDTPVVELALYAAYTYRLGRQ